MYGVICLHREHCCRWYLDHILVIPIMCADVLLGGRKVGTAIDINFRT